MSLADNLKQIRRDQGVSQAQLAKITGISQQSLSRLESGVDKTSKHLPKIAAALRVPVSKLDPSYLTPVLSDDWVAILRRAARAAVDSNATLQQISEVLADEFHNSLALRLRQRIDELPPEQQQSVVEAAEKISGKQDMPGTSRKADT